MLNIIAPPGCYGTYIARCLHFYCDSTAVPYEMTFDAAGSSHSYREILNNSPDKIANSHLRDDNFVNQLSLSTAVVITGHPDHLLDYHNNQFIKQALGNIIEFLVTHFSEDIIKEKLKQHWNYTDPLDDQVPLWIIREFWSFWMVDCWKDTYSIERYLNIPHSVGFCCSKLWTDDFYKLLLEICEKTNRTIYDSEENIKNNHLLFLSKQRYHNSQKRIIKWVDDVVNNINSKSPCRTILDEAYVQHLLRSYGYEIQCDGLNLFPTTSLTLKKITNLVT
jgi:hypothetical protein